MDLESMNAMLENATAEERVAWALERFRPEIVLSSSFGAQAAVCLHLATQQWPQIPVVLLDTQYLFPETYRFIDELTERLHLNLHVYQSPFSREWQEARWGKLWEQGIEGLTKYNTINKVEPMQRALQALGAKAWIAGLRRGQSSTRARLAPLALQDGRVKVHPIVDWSSRDVHTYLEKHGLPYHPLWYQGYASIGDTHTSQALTGNMTEEESRFFGLNRECGLHETTRE